MVTVHVTGITRLNHKVKGKIIAVDFTWPGGGSTIYVADRGQSDRDAINEAVAKLRQLLRKEVEVAMNG